LADIRRTAKPTSIGRFPCKSAPFSDAQLTKASLPLRTLRSVFKPFTPLLSGAAACVFGQDLLSWQRIRTSAPPRQVQAYEHRSIGTSLTALDKLETCPTGRSNDGFAYRTILADSLLELTLHHCTDYAIVSRPSVKAPNPPELPVHLKVFRCSTT